MITRIRQYFEQYIIVTETVDQASIEHQLQLACAALMIEVMYADHSIHDDEKKHLHDIIKQAFQLSDDETNTLIQLAEEEKHAATDYYQFTSLINKHYTQQQKRELITRLWQIAYADESIHKFEEHLIRRLADLLHVPHSAFIYSKHKALNK